MKSKYLNNCIQKSNSKATGPWYCHYSSWNVMSVKFRNNIWQMIMFQSYHLQIWKWQGSKAPFFCEHHSHQLGMCARPETKSALLSRSAMKSWFLILMNVQLVLKTHCPLGAYPKQGSNFQQWGGRVLCAVHLYPQRRFIQLGECPNCVAQNCQCYKSELN